MNALQVQEVSKSYNDFKAMDGISFTIQKGSLFGILEPNGAGKTTTMRIIMNIIIQDTGQVEILREPFRQAVKNRIGYLPEERGLYPKMKLLAQLQVLGEMKGLSTGHSQKLAEEAPGCFGLTQWMKHKVQDLSKGMQQKVQFIGTIMHSPDLIILDEPFSGLDPINAKFLKDVLLMLKRKGKTIILVTHLMDQAEKLCDEICLINRGKVVVKAAPPQLFKAVAASNLSVKKFGAAKTSLNEIFIDLVGGAMNAEDN